MSQQEHEAKAPASRGLVFSPEHMRQLAEYDAFRAIEAARKAERIERNAHGVAAAYRYGVEGLALQAHIARHGLALPVDDDAAKTYERACQIARQRASTTEVA